MSEEGSFGLNFVEKVLGFVVLFAGAVLGYYTFTSGPALGTYTGFFGVISVGVALLGFILMTAKTEE